MVTTIHTYNRIWRTEKWLLVFLAVHFLVWWLLALTTQPSLPMDTLEKILWGQEWQSLYYRHPPLASWLTAAAQAIGGEVLVKTLSPLAVILACWAVWLLACEWLDKRRAFIAVLLLEGVIYFNFTSPEFNENVVSLPVWAFFALFGWRVLNYGKTVDWLLCGLFAALCLLAKYSGILILAAWFCVMLSLKPGRERLFSFAALIGLMAFVAIFGSTARGLWEHNFQSITEFALSRTATAQSASAHVQYPLRFLLSQLGALIPFLLLCMALVARRRKQPIRLSVESRCYLIAVCFLPVVFALLISAVGGLRLKTMWGSMMWCFIGIFAVVYLTRFRWRVRRFARCWSGIFLLGVFAYGTQNIVAPLFKQIGSRVHFPGAAFAAQIEAEWQTQYPDHPWIYVLGESGVAGGIAYYGQGEKRLVMDGLVQKNYWLNEEDLRQKGGVLVWRKKDDNAPGFVKEYPTAIIQPPLQASWMTIADLPAATLGWMILPPQPTNLSEAEGSGRK